MARQADLVKIGREGYALLEEFYGTRNRKKPHPSKDPIMVQYQQAVQTFSSTMDHYPRKDPIMVQYPSKDPIMVQYPSKDPTMVQYPSKFRSFVATGRPSSCDGSYYQNNTP
ncbi:hypothetical protein LOK49_LG08G03263 [Camellia lanceoleosa]|uniref:Uncharacterized protein n=1 Tax=Camellia lanceoleosa TaxID=1840588 RepID=A0ACC0GP81_9ERIC|nr:hypothetical protein LOK49_LG08G03263 [Camellia lanceoleosa]